MGNAVELLSVSFLENGARARVRELSKKDASLHVNYCTSQFSQVPPSAKSDNAITPTAGFASPRYSFDWKTCCLNVTAVHSVCLLTTCCLDSPPNIVAHLSGSQASSSGYFHLLIRKRTKTEQQNKRKRFYNSALMKPWIYFIRFFQQHHLLILNLNAFSGQQKQETRSCCSSIFGRGCTFPNAVTLIEFLSEKHRNIYYSLQITGGVAFVCLTK